jgi:hypothetical protein
MAPPKIFISYSHDSPAHEAKVLALANRLRGDGIDAVLDQYETFPPTGWIQWMKRQVRDAQFVLVVCTETYRRRAGGDEEPGVGLGAIYESQRIQQLLYDAGGVNERFIPVLLGASDRQPHAKMAARLVEDFGLASPVAARLLNESGCYLVGRAQYPEAGPLCRRALAIREKALGPEHPDTANSIRNYAELLKKLGHRAEAERLEARVKGSPPFQNSHPSLPQ